YFFLLKYASVGSNKHSFFEKTSSRVIIQGVFDPFFIIIQKLKKFQPMPSPQRLMANTIINNG
ncbi:MAG: hypothetical protein CRN43_00285, partial [Candidatus Nephrothrix sp. EaCA]